MKRIPVNAIKDYFGMKVALYFKFLEKYTRFMLFAVIFGIFAEIPEILGFHEDWVTFFFAVYCIGIIIWATAFSETWRNEEQITNI